MRVGGLRRARGRPPADLRLGADRGGRRRPRPRTRSSSQGWVREDSAEGVYITESPETTIAVDEEGYGMTYLFGDGWVKLADTKQGLLLIEWPKS